MDFSSDANANFEDSLDVNQEIHMPRMMEKTSSAAQFLMRRKYAKSGHACRSNAGNDRQFSYMIVVECMY